MKHRKFNKENFIEHIKTLRRINKQYFQEINKTGKLKNIVVDNNKIDFNNITEKDLYLFYESGKEQILFELSNYFDNININLNI